MHLNFTDTPRSPDTPGFTGRLTSMTIEIPKRLEIATISSIEEFSELADQWDGLVRAMPRPSPFFLHCWLEQWWRHYSAEGKLCVVVARRDGRLVGALPIYVRRRRGLRILEFLGADQSALADALLAPSEDAAVVTDLADRALKIPHDLVDLFGLPGDSRLAGALGRGRLRMIERIESPVLDLAAGWDEVYRAKTTSKKRNLHKRRRRQLSELGRLEVTVARDSETTGPALEEAFRLHALRWEGRPDGSGFGTPIGMRFHRAALSALAELDIPRIVTLRLDKRPIAFHYYFALCGCMYVHRLAFDPALARFSPGQVNTLDAIQTASDEGLTRVEFLGGGERYKVELADRFEPLYEGVGLARTPQGHAVAAARVGVINLRRTLKKSPNARRFYFEMLAPARRIVARRRRR
jgi:CelD/BcsL family acetyltransferase involved in cellulose biosynthesis